MERVAHQGADSRSCAVGDRQVFDVGTYREVRIKRSESDAHYLGRFMRTGLHTVAVQDDHQTH